MSVPCVMQVRSFVKTCKVANYCKKMKQLYGLSDEQCFDDWRHLAAEAKMADCAFVCTQDRMHKAPAVALASKGYHLLLEKPMAVDEGECEEMAETFEREGVVVAVCHVLRSGILEEQ